MLFKVKSLGLFAGRPVAIISKKTARLLSVHLDQRVKIMHRKKEVISILDIATGLLRDDEIVLSQEIINTLHLKKHQVVEIIPINDNESARYIREKIKGKELNEYQIRTIIADIVNNRLTDSEIAYFVAAAYINHMNMKEIEYLTRAIVETGKRLTFDTRVVADKHCIGGVAGNRTTPIVVAICAAAGLTIPKTSSRAITSAAGTADTIETIAKVEFSAAQIKNIVKKAKGCLVWGGTLGLAPADDKIIQVEKSINIDPEAQLLASIISKKIAVGSTHVLIDIPCGKSAKFSRKEAEKLAHKFLHLADQFKLKMKVVLTDGSEPIGNGIGPVLEMRDIIAVLRQDRHRPLDLEKKSVQLAGHLLELTECVKKGKGVMLAEKILKSKEAYKRFEKIVRAQHGSVQDADRKLRPGKFALTLKAGRTGTIQSIDNKKMNSLARAAGCPADKAAGIYLFHHCREKVEREAPLLTIYAQTEARLKHAVQMYRNLQPILIK